MPGWRQVLGWEAGPTYEEDPRFVLTLRVPVNGDIILDSTTLAAAADEVRRLAGTGDQAGWFPDANIEWELNDLTDNHPYPYMLYDPVTETTYYYQEDGTWAE